MRGRCKRGSRLSAATWDERLGRKSDHLADRAISPPGEDRVKDGRERRRWSKAACAQLSALGYPLAVLAVDHATPSRDCRTFELIHHAVPSRNRLRPCAPAREQCRPCARLRVVVIAQPAAAAGEVKIATVRAL